MNRKEPRKFKDLVAPGIKRACRMVGFCLTLGNVPAMWELSAILHCRWRPHERAILALAALMALTDDEYQAVIEFVEREE